MEFNKLVFAGLAVGCVAAAGGGAYLAVRHNRAPHAIVAAAASLPSADATAVPVAGKPAAVTESEGVISPAASTAPSAPFDSARENAGLAQGKPAPKREPQISSRPASSTST